jgi:uncharacterized protein YggE
MQEARAKAEYLITSIGEKLGGALEIQEINNDAQPEIMNFAKTVLRAASSEDSMPEIDFKKIKLNYQIRAVFEIR